MNKELKKRILTSYEYHDDNDISTSRLIQMVADDCHCTTVEVVDVLAEDDEAESEE